MITNVRLALKHWLRPFEQGGIVLLVFALLLSGLPGVDASQTNSAPPAVVSLPDGAMSRIPSPGGRWTLIFECPDDCSERKLSIEDNDRHVRRFIKDYDRSLSISWAPDAEHFFVNDAWGSDGESCLVYELATLTTVDVATILLANDPEVKTFLRAGHSYVQATRWISTGKLIVVLFGHFNDPPARGFTLRYRVDLNGKAQRMSQKWSEQPPQ